MPNLHEGHRRRLKERFLKDGLDGFEAHNVLELLLFYAIPQRDTNDLAHQLLQRFGSLSAVFEADYEELCQLPGVGTNVATLLKLIPDLTRRYLEDLKAEVPVLKDVEQIADFLLYGESRKTLQCNIMLFPIFFFLLAERAFPLLPQLDQYLAGFIVGLLPHLTKCPVRFRDAVIRLDFHSVQLCQ